MSSRGAAAGGMSVDAAFASCTDGLDALTAEPWWQLSDEQLAQRVQDLSRLESRAAAAQAGAIAEAVSRGSPAQGGAKSAAVWFRGLVPVTPAVARARVALAEAFGTPASAVRELAPTRQAFAAGMIAPGQAGVLVRTMAAVADLPEPVDGRTRAEVQELLISVATRLDPAQLGQAGRRVVHRLDPDAGDRLAREEDCQQRAREAYLIQEGSGMWLLRGYLPPVAGAALAAALDPLAAPQPAADGTPDPRPARQRTADALHLLAETSLAARPGGPGALPTRAAAPTRLILTGTVDTLLAKVSQPGGQRGVPPAVLDNGTAAGWEVSPLTAQLLACEADLVPMLLDGAGRPLDVGDTRYAFPPRIRKAIEVRDRHCTFDACTAKPAWCHTHHLTPFRCGGPTSEANGALLCGPHHRHVHAHAWQGQILDGHVRWRAPDAGQDTSNADQQGFEQALRHLLIRWLARTGRPHDPDNTS